LAVKRPFGGELRKPDLRLNFTSLFSKPHL
jgi:hypothetical protein